MEKKNVVRMAVMFVLIIVLMIMAGCSEKNPVIAPTSQNSALAKPGIQTKFQQVNLVSDLSMPGVRTDPNLLNGWGLTVTPNGIFWISTNHSGMSVIYDSAGNQRINPVTIPTSGNVAGGAPSGVVFNSTPFFKLSTGNPGRFFFAGEDGIISAWEPSLGSMATVVVDQSAQTSVYKGIEMAQNGSNFFLYATNFRLSRIDVFDTNFTLVNTMPFSDPNIPAGFAPFNIKKINGMLFVTYALHKAPDNMDDQKGPGNGYIDIYTTGGELVSRFASQGSLNSPWGIAEGFDNDKLGNTILIGNFGDGRINVFGTSGEFLGQVRDEKEKPVTIEGLWAVFTSKTIPAVGNRIYFTAGPNLENDGLFGYLLSKFSDTNNNSSVSNNNTLKTQ
jgi:uncharacterized protein (TIGR03118 family)